MKIKFVISSRKMGFENTYPVVIKSLLENGIPAEDIYFIVGGYDKVSKYLNEDGINFIKVNQNSIDYTGLIAVVDLELQSDYWVLLHDTCYVGPGFYNTIKTYNYDNAPAVALSFDLSMNIGAYSYNYLQQIKEELLTYRNTDFSIESIQHYKQKGVSDEDKFLSMYREQYHYCNTTREGSGPVDIYGTGVLRMIEYFPGIDLYKVKANWHGKSTYELNV